VLRCRRVLPCLLFGLIALVGLPTFAGEAPAPAEWLISGGTVVDGTGAPGRVADVRIRGDRIVEIGSIPPAPGVTVIEARGLVVAPGFIDLHTHSDGPLRKPETRTNRNYQAQGVTTVVTGNCGSGPLDVADFLATLDRQGIGTNVAHLLPHGDIRRKVMGTQKRPPSDTELQAMEALVERGMTDGAWGLSTGLIYIPSQYADTPELIALAKVVGRHGGFYASHIRNEGDALVQAVDEAIAIGRAAGCPAHISHLKASGRANWGRIAEACARIERARAEGLAVTADQYPYIASSTSLSAMVIPDWAVVSPSFAAVADDPEQGPRLRHEIAAALERRDAGAAVRIARLAARPQWVGRNLVQIADTEQLDPVEVVIAIQKLGGAQAIAFGMSEDDVREAMKRPYVATASDGAAHQAGGGDRPHPRSYGTFPRKLRYALDDQVLPLEQAIASCSGLPAAILGLPDRGTLRVGAFADVVVFDPARFRDAATFDDPTQLAPGVVQLFVNGQRAIADGAFAEVLAGRTLRRDHDGPADSLVTARRIWTGDPARPWASAVAIRQGQVAAVGSVEELRPFLGPETRRLDFPEGFITPGLIDAHGHMSGLGSAIDEIDLRGVDSLAKVAQLVRERIQALPPDAWVIGQNWDQSLWPGGAFPTAAVLDVVAPDRPVWLTRVDGHAGWANSEALRRAKVDAATQPPSDGQIVRDAQGRPTGVFVDGAMGLVTRAIPAPGRSDRIRHLLAAQERALAAGLSGVHDAGISPIEVDAYQELERDGRLKIRIYGMASPPGGGEAAFVRDTKPIRHEPGRRFELRAIKLFIDGAMGSRGALLFEPYADDPGNFGLQLITPETLLETTKAALANGWQVCTHAIGDRGNAQVLDAYDAALAAVPTARDPRLRVEHAQVVRRQDVPRFRELGVIVSMQPAHAGTDQRWADARLGPERVQGAYAWSWFRDDGVRLALGSDFPVEIVSPFWGLYAAVTRQNERGEPAAGWYPQHRLTLEQALAGHTAGSAHAGFAEDRLGVLRPGLEADLTVVDRDLFQVEPAAIREPRVLATIIAGETVYRAAGD
jgi:predicted amidohydrolase YtcJ